MPRRSTSAQAIGGTVVEILNGAIAEASPPLVGWVKVTVKASSTSTSRPKHREALTQFCRPGLSLVARAGQNSGLKSSPPPPQVGSDALAVAANTALHAVTMR